MCKLCIRRRRNFRDMSSILEEEDEEETPCSPVEEEILDSLPAPLQVYLTRTLSSDRTNQMTKTHNDLDAILQLLQEKEKDLELAARIGQSLLERNKNLMQKTEVMEKYLGEHTDREEQLRHDIVRKNELLQKFLNDQEDMFFEGDNRSEEGSKGSDTPSLARDDSFNTLTNKCHLLEQQNTRFILEALQIKEQTASEEQKERQLVEDCVEQLIEAKDQISSLTDDIARKAEDNVRQQEEISQLITTVVDLQKRHSQLSNDNEELSNLLNESQVGQDELKKQIADLQEKYHECFEILMENQQEMKTLNKKIETPTHKPSSPGKNLARDSLAHEIEQSVKRDLADLQEKRHNLARVLQTVRNINVSKGRKPKVGKPQPSPGNSGSSGFKFNPVTGGDLPRQTSDASIDSDDGASSLDSRFSYGRRSFRKPEKLQIVKPIKGSVTLQQWKKLASPSMKLEQQRPGVHVKGDLLKSPRDGKLSREHSDVSDADDIEEDEPIQIKIRSKTDHQSPVEQPPQEARKHSPISLALASLIHEKGIQAGSQDSASSSILAQLLNSPSASTPGKSSVGQVLADVLQKASEEASAKEPKRAESLRNLANYFSEKEKAGKTEPETIPEDDSPPVSPPSVPVYSPLPGVGILSRMLVGSTGITASIPTARPIATVAGSTNTSTTRSSTVPGLSRTGFSRTSSGTNLKGLDINALSPADKRLSLDTTDLMSSNSIFPNDTTSTSFPSLRRRASSGDLQSMHSSQDLTGSVNSLGLGTSLRRRGSLTDLTQSTETSTVNPGGFFGRLTRRSSIGSLTDLVQKSNLGAASIPGRMERASSIDTSMVARSGQTPPSPSQFDTNRSFFPTTPEPSKGLLSSFAGVRAGMSSQEPSSASHRNLSQAASNKSEDRLEKINKAFAFEDFGGMGLMSFFGSKKSQNK